MGSRDELINVNFPFELNDRGQLQQVGYVEHVRQMVEQVLLTARGERVNLPEFGSGLIERLFEGNDNALVAGTRNDVVRSLQQGLGSVITVQDVNVALSGATLQISVTYVIIATDQKQTVTVSA